MSDTGASGRPGRYERSFGGLVAATVVLVLAVLAFVAFRGLFRDIPEVEPERVDYLPVVEALQQQGRRVAYPARLPEGWLPTSVTLGEPDDPVWGIGVLTDEGDFVGLRQADEDVDDLLDTYVDEDAGEAEPLRVTGSVATDWDGYSDEGGDHAFATEVAGAEGPETLLVFGSAPEEDLETFIGLLTLEERAPAS